MAKAKRRRHGTATRQARTRLPKMDVEQTKQRGARALELAVQYRTQVEPRLPAGTIDGLRTDLAAVNVVVPNADGARVQKRAATATERAAATAIVRHIGHLTDAVKHAHAGDKAVLRAWGVGARINAEVTRTVLARGDQVVARARAFPAEMRAAGILDVDVTALDTALTGLRGADSNQAVIVSSAKDATRERNETLVRIQMATHNVAVVGRVAFSAEYDAATIALFSALLVPVGRGNHHHPAPAAPHPAPSGPHA
jgi:hypothetical protein